MAQMYGLASIYLTITSYAGHTQALSQNLSCEHEGSCARAQEAQAICPAGHYCSDDGKQVIPCRAGSFRSDGEVNQCMDCPVNFFNHLVGQIACFPCGSEATQPKEGLSTCLCRGEGQVFQPGDGRCPCAPGYQPRDSTTNCKQIVYDICRDGSVRNQEGQCLNKEEWVDYCSNKVCVNHEYYQGYDKVLGLCICLTEDLDNICNAECRRRQNHILQIVCVEEIPEIQAIDASGEQVPFTTWDTFGALVVVPPVDKLLCSSSQRNSFHSIYVVTVTEQGFWGIYNANRQFLQQISDGQFNISLLNLSGEDRKSSFSGILNPTTCIRVNDFIMFIVSKHNFPMYDVNNLYNTNREFDWGKFRNLAEEVWLSSRPHFLFLHQFQDPGVYVFKLSGNHYKKMYLRVMMNGGQCYEDGPFFPTAPRHVIRNGIAKAPRQLLKPDWPAITGIITGLLLILITCILLLVWFQGLGWTQKAASLPTFRRRQLKYNFNSYSSKGSTVSTAKKVHPKMRIKGHADKKWNETDRKKCQNFLTDDEFWDYEQQIDMECFSAHIFYDILLKQSLLVTAKLGHLKEEVKLYYEKLVEEVSSLKDIFLRSLNISGKQKHYSTSVLENYQKKKREAEQEIARRKKLAAEYEDILNRQLSNLQQEVKCQEEHCVEFNGALRECLRLLEMLKNKNRSEDPGTKPSTYNCRLLVLQLEGACNRMYAAVMKESERLKAWGVLGDGTGAYLVNKDRTNALTKKDLIALDGSIRESELVGVNPVHGLLTPASQTAMILSSHYLMPVPNDYFVHSETGKVLPIAGNVVYDPATSQLVTAVDSAFGEIWTAETLLFPFVPYPACPNTGLPVTCNLPSIHHHSKFEGWTLMLDNASGMEVPILAVTVHPQTRQWMALGGTYCHPLTSLISPIEIGGPMIDAKTGKIFPVLGAQLDSDTGRVIPVGGMMSMSGVISVLGDHFTEPLSGKKSRVQGAVFHQGKVVPHAGGYQALLESNLLMAEINVIDTLKALKDLIPGEDFTVNDDFEEAYRILGKAMENMKKSVATLQKHLMYRKCNASCQQKMTADFKTHGGNLGMITYPKTELWMSAVMGMEIPDPGPSDLMVPILGVEYDFVTGHLIPLAGTMEDAEGKGLIPIKLGARTIDPITGDSGSVVDAQTNPLTGIVMPIVHPGGSTKGKDYYLLEALGKELKSRERCWQNQKIKEEELLKDLKLLIYYVLDVAREDKTHKSRLKEKFASLEDVCQSIEGVGLRETQRRTDQNLCSLSIKISELPFINDNGEEMEQQLIFLMVVRKTMEKIIQFSGKIEQETEKVQSQLREWQKSKEHGSEDIVKSKQKMVTLRLVGEFEDHMMKRLTGVDTAYSRLEYVREYTRLQGLQAKSFLLGRTPQYVNSQKSYWNAHSKEVQDLGRALNPMLKYLIQIIEDNKNCVLTSEKQVPASGYSSRTTLKASAANSDSFQVAGNGDTEKTTLQLPWLISTDFIFRHQDCLFRFLMEKQASELVHLERLLITEEINKIWNFYETYKVCPYGNVEGNQSELIFSSIDTDTIEIGQRSPGKIPEACQETDLHCEWHRFIEELTEVHRAAIVALCQKHTEGVKSLGFNPASFIPEEYFNSDVKVSLLHLAKKMLSTYGQRHCDSIREVQGMTSVDCKLSLDEKAHVGLLRIIAAKFVKQELLIQIRTYTILDAYNKLQVDNCAWEIRKILHNFHYESPSGKQASEEVANAMEESQVENLIDFLRKSYKEEQLQHIQSPLSEMQVQLKEQHCSLTEQLLQNKDTSLFQELARSEDKSHMEHIIFLVLSQRHLRQAVLLQEAAKAPKHDQEKLARKWTNSADDALSVIDCLQEDIFNISNNKTEISLLLMELQHVVKRIQMRGHHVEEVANELKEYCTDKVHILSFVEEAHCFANELHAFKEQRMKQFSGQLKKLSYLARDREKPPALDRGNEEEEGFREEKTLLSALQKKQAELEQDHRKQVSDEGLKLQDRLERGELNAFWKQNLIKEHDETVTFLERTFRSDLETLKMKLEEVKKKEVEIHDVNASASSGKCCARNDEQNIATLLAENITLFQQVEQIAALRKSLLGPQLYCPSIPPAGDTTQLSEPSPVLALLKEVDSQLRENAETAQIIHGNTESHKGNTFRDILDLQLISKEKLAIVNEDDLTPREAVVYQYGIYIVELLKPRLEIAKLDLCVASSLPENCHKGNAFNNSFFYQTIEKKLYVSREYLQSVGSLVLLLVHCMSHIACEELSDDSDPFFRRAFYQAAKTCFNDGFFSTFQKCPSGQGITSSSRVHTNLETEEMQTNKCADLRLNPFLLRLKTASGKPGFNETFNDRHESLCEYKTEVLLRDILGERKRKLFNKSFKDDTNESGSKARLIENVSVKHLEDELDQLNFHLMKILEKEADLQDELKEDNKTHCYFQMITLEKECIRKKIEDLEDKIDKLMRLA